VTEHRIRLRGGWGCRAAGSPESEERWLNLPVRWGPEYGRRLILTRRFGRPPLGRASQVLLLQMDQVEGILSLTLNGQPISGVSPETSRYQVPLEGLSERNVLVVEVETPKLGANPGGGSGEWGMIALVVRTVDPAEDSA
jgi:hypothetical protein